MQMFNERGSWEEAQGRQQPGAQTEMAEGINIQKSTVWPSVAKRMHRRGMGNKSEIFWDFLHERGWKDRYMDLKPECVQVTSARVL